MKAAKMKFAKLINLRTSITYLREENRQKTWFNRIGDGKYPSR